MPKDLIEVICILERGEKCHAYEIILKRNYFTLLTKFPAKKGESTQLKNIASGRQTASHQDKKEVSSEEKLLKRSVERSNFHLVLLDQSVRIDIWIRTFKILPM